MTVPTSLGIYGAPTRDGVAQEKKVYVYIEKERAGRKREKDHSKEKEKEREEKEKETDIGDGWCIREKRDIRCERRTKKKSVARGSSSIG